GGPGDRRHVPVRAGCRVRGVRHGQIRQRHPDLGVRRLPAGWGAGPLPVRLHPGQPVRAGPAGRRGPGDRAELAAPGHPHAGAGGRRAAGGPGPRRLAAGLLLGHLRPGVRGTAGGPPGDDPLVLRRPLPGTVPGRRAGPGRALRGRHPGADQRRHLGRDRPVAAGAAHGGRPGGRQRGGPPDGGAAAPRRRPGTVRRAPAAGRPAARPQRPAGLDDRAPLRRDHGGRPGPPGAPVRADVRPPVPGGDRDHAALLAGLAAGAAGPAAAGDDRAGRGRGGPAVRFRRRRGPAAPLRGPGRHLAAALSQNVPPGGV
ncbi:MAG: Transcriptional regulator, AraC family, partial [uncultured Corynebacteriales bacterium]